MYVADRAAWRRWLARHHATSDPIWLVFDKKGANPDRLAYADAVEEALCFGWIDSTLRPLSDTQYRQLFSRRKPGSTWSKVNKARVERLTSEGRMAPAGLAAVEAARSNGAWASLDHVESLVVPDDLARALAANPAAERNFAAAAPSTRKMALSRVLRVKKPETRAARVRQVVEWMAESRTPRRPPRAAPGA